MEDNALSHPRPSLATVRLPPHAWWALLLSRTLGWVTLTVVVSFPPVALLGLWVAFGGNILDPSAFHLLPWTLGVAVGAVALALPFALGGALFASELAGGRTRRGLLWVLARLRGMPTVSLTVALVLLFGRGALLPALALSLYPWLCWRLYRLFHRIPRAYRRVGLNLGVRPGRLIRDLILPLSWRPLSGCLLVAVAEAVTEAVLPALAGSGQGSTTLAGHLLQTVFHEGVASPARVLLLLSQLYLVVAALRVVALVLVGASWTDPVLEDTDVPD